MRLMILAILSFILILNCSDKSVGEKQIMDQSLKQDLQIISKARIFFGHQSVGYNIVSGLAELNKEAQTGVNIVEWNEKPIKFPSAFFAHKRNGINEQPETKCDAFEQFLTPDIADSLDIAFFKFCYIDINKDTDVQALFAEYKNTMKRIREKYPRLKLIYVTVPLRQVQSGWKASIKKILGKELGHAAENIKRNRFNDLLRSEYKNEIVFDLAMAESTYPDGKRQTFELANNKYYSLIPAYTRDGGHLNSLGSEWVANKMVHTLVRALAKNE